ncbi:MAG: diadenylate cyclase CdaA [Clostridia bacterium]|nr:diadenylate cyclase CdaA [Clostridia bacterium]
MSFFLKIWDQICAFTLEYIVQPILGMGIKDVIDILILAVVLYQLYRFFRDRRAGRVLIGLGAVVVVSLLVSLFELSALSYIVRLFAASAFFCVIVIFQPEIRDALERLGNLTVLNPRSNSLPRKKMNLAKSVADETVDAVMVMSQNKTGALIVFEGMTKLGDYIHTGKPVDARVTSKLLQNIFFAPAPLHDGALIIRDMRIYAASCVLPSSTRKSVDFGSLGTRHRAAVGVTEVSDALVVVVSEQTGTVSVAQDGKLLRNVDGKTLCDILMTYMAGSVYLRHKRANMRKEYLEMMENIARVDPPVAPKDKSEAVEKEFEKMVGNVTETETDATLDESNAAPANAPSESKKSDEPTDQEI